MNASASGIRITDAGSFARFVWRVKNCDTNYCEWRSSWCTPFAYTLCDSSVIVRLASCIRANRGYDFFVVKTRGACPNLIPSRMARIYSRSLIRTSANSVDNCLRSRHLFDDWFSSILIGAICSRTCCYHGEWSSRGFYAFPGTQSCRVLEPFACFIANHSRLPA